MAAINSMCFKNPVKYIRAWKTYFMWAWCSRVLWVGLGHTRKVAEKVRGSKSARSFLLLVPASVQIPDSCLEVPSRLSFLR